MPRNIIIEIKMGKKIQNQKILNESDSESQAEIHQKGMNQSQCQEKVKAKKSKDGMSGGRALDSSHECPIGAILKEESIPSTTHYYSPAPAPGSVAAPVNPQKTGHLKKTCDKGHCASVTKTIKK